MGEEKKKDWREKTSNCTNRNLMKLSLFFWEAGNVSKEEWLVWTRSARLVGILIIVTHSSLKPPHPRTGTAEFYLWKNSASQTFIQLQTAFCFKTYNLMKLTWWAPNSMGWVFLLLPRSNIAKSLTLQDSRTIGRGPSKRPESLGRRSKDSGK